MAAVLEEEVVEVVVGVVDVDEVDVDVVVGVVVEEVVGGAC